MSIAVRWADEIIVVDSESKDRTVEIARKYTSNVFIERWLGFAAAKSFGLSKTNSEWILWLDADERVTPELANEIQILLKLNPDQAAFRVKRKAYFLGKWIRHSGWYPGRVTRLFHRNRARFNSAAVHEGLEIDGIISNLNNDLLHFTDPNLYHYISKLNRYTSLAANESHMRGKRCSRIDIFLRPAWQFTRMYFVRLGFLDGKPGLLLAILSASYVMTKYAKIWELDRKADTI
ncbi:MAG: glycosyltransferase family 2 protein [Ignavibacteriales bacterium]|nr:glycosyltransferase family 2 protein [Ignavibacteriales bacterium]